jgi:predicted RNase H-like HicB family nuclease
MSDEKSGATAPKGTKKKSRTKRETSSSAPPSETVKVEESVRETEEKPRDLQNRQSSSESYDSSESDVTPVSEREFDADEKNKDTADVTNAGARPQNSGNGATQPNRNERRGGSSDVEKTKPGDEYSWHTFYDRFNRNFVATVVEFPELKATGATREAATRSLESKVDQHISNLKRRNTPLPEAIQSRRYPERLDVKISQNLYRKLDLLSRQEKVSLDQLVSEYLSGVVEKKAEPPRNQHQHQSQRSHGERGNQRGHGHQGGHHGGHQGGHQGGQHRGGNPRSRGYDKTLESRENFMEYVRNLEKGNWRKK